MSTQQVSIVANVLVASVLVASVLEASVIIANVLVVSVLLSSALQGITMQKGCLAWIPHFAICGIEDKIHPFDVCHFADPYNK